MDATWRLLRRLESPGAVKLITCLLIGGVVLGVLVPALVPNLPRALFYAFTWFGILCCVSQSALCSGLTIGLTGMDEVNLEARASTGDKDAQAIYELHKTGNRLPFSLLWANVLFNVALPIMVTIAFGWLPVGIAMVANMIFSSVVIAHFGEIFPVGIVGLHKYRIGAVLSPAIKIYMVILRPLVALDISLFTRCFGKAKPEYIKEDVFCEILNIHAENSTEIGEFEAKCATNVFRFDDLKVNQEGEVLDDASILEVPFSAGIPNIENTESFLKRALACDKKWVVLVNEENGTPEAVLKVRKWLRHYFLRPDSVDPRDFCHKPLLVTDSTDHVADWVKKLKVHAERDGDDVVDNDVIIVWNHERRIITGTDILGRLLRGLVNKVNAPTN